MVDDALGSPSPVPLTDSAASAEHDQQSFPLTDDHAGSKPVFSTAPSANFYGDDRVRSLMRAIGPDVVFEPRCEEEFDQVLARWHRLAHTEEDLKTVLFLKAADELQEIIVDLQLQSKPYVNYVDQLARALFPESQDLSKVGEAIQARRQQDDVVTTISTFLKLRKRFQVLCVRWPLPLLGAIPVTKTTR